MKGIILIFILFIFVGCNGEEGGEPISTITPPVVNPDPDPDDVTVQAGRTYNPSSWSNYENTVGFDAYYEIDTKIYVTTGNSGTGWASIVVNNARYCYQGNASNNNTPNGTLFILDHMRTNLTKQCFEFSGKLTPIIKVQTQKDSLIRMEVHGGGCSNSNGACENTEAEFTLHLASPPAQDFTIVASRTYGPSSWTNYEGEFESDASYIVDDKMLVLAGNSGTGWASLTVNSTKFCYQGNASNNNTPNGSLFNLDHMRTGPNYNCHSNSGKIPANTTINVQAGDAMMLEVHGGGCGSVCEDTRASLSIYGL